MKQVVFKGSLLTTALCTLAYLTACGGSSQPSIASTPSQTSPGTTSTSSGTPSSAPPPTGSSGSGTSAGTGSTGSGSGTSTGSGSSSGTGSTSSGGGTSSGSGSSSGTGSTGSGSTGSGSGSGSGSGGGSGSGSGNSTGSVQLSLVTANAIQAGVTVPDGVWADANYVYFASFDGTSASSTSGRQVFPSSPMFRRPCSCSRCVAI